MSMYICVPCMGKHKLEAGTPGYTTYCQLCGHLHWDWRASKSVWLCTSLHRPIGNTREKGRWDVLMQVTEKNSPAVTKVDGIDRKDLVAVIPALIYEHKPKAVHIDFDSLRMFTAKGNRGHDYTSKEFRGDVIYSAMGVKLLPFMPPDAKFEETGTIYLVSK